MMERLRVLHLEDEVDYSHLVGDLLRAEGFDIELTLATNRAEFEAALCFQQFDVILADYLLPDFNGLEALAAARRQTPETPFLLVSGTIGEQAAIESLRNGATDYVLKQWPDRLVPTIRRAVEEAAERARRRHAETELIRREKYFRALTDNSPDILTVLSRDGLFLHVSPSAQRIMGYEPGELLGRSAFEWVHPEDLARVVEGFQLLLTHPEQTMTMAFRFLRKQGSWAYLESVAQNRLPDPDIGAVIINSRDVTERTMAENALRVSENEYRLMFDGNPNPMWLLDVETLGFLEVNQAAIAHYGYSREEFLKLRLTDLRLEGEASELSGQFHDESDAGRSRLWQHRKKDGARIDVEVTWSPLTFRGRPAALTLVTDITDRRNFEHRNAAFSKLGRSLNSAATPAEAARIIRDVAHELFAWDAFSLDLYLEEADLMDPILDVDTIEGRRVEELYLKRAHPVSEQARRIIKNGAELILREGPLRMMADAVPFGDVSRPSASLMLVPIRDRTKVIGILSIQSYSFQAYSGRDLETLQILADHCGGALERIRAREALRESEQRFRDLFEGSPDATFVEDLEGNVLDVNPAACRLHGVSRAELVGTNVLELVPAEKRDLVKHEFAKLASGEVIHVESESRARDGRITPVEIRANRVQYDGRPAVLLHVRDVTERKQTERALRSSEMLFHSVWENSVDGMRLTDENGIVVAVNQAFCHLTGLTRLELEGKPFTVIYADSEQPERILQKYRERFRGRVIERQIERRIVLHNGHAVVLEDTNSFVELRGQPPLLLGLFRDVTAQKRLEEQFRQAQKMEAIGQLAGGVAHDFNNILTVIHGHASLLLAGGAVAGPAARSAQQIIQAADRAAGLTRQLLTFSRRQVMQPRRLDLNELVRDMSKMLGRILGEDIALQLSYWPEPMIVRADPSMLEQILLNFAVNARDAMPRGGRLNIELAYTEVAANRVMRQVEARAGCFVRLTASDTGCGIAPEILRRIFEPFFTTKEVGKGTGLGLATVYGIVKQHQGWIEVESQLGKGTTFQVYLPLAAEGADRTDERGGERVVRGGSETILVVEDEQPVRELVGNLLRNHGYRVLEAETGVRALDVWRQHKQDIALLLTDVVMPDRVNGRALAEELWSERPDLKVIFTSGYSADVLGKDFTNRRTLNYVQKPYHPQRLAATVRDCLDATDLIPAT